MTTLFRVSIEVAGIDDALATFMVHGEPASEVLERPWGERSFYVNDPWGNELCFVEQGTLYT